MLKYDLVVIGGGVIGLEMASYFNSVGSEVTVIEMLDKIAGPTDKEISKILQKNYEAKVALCEAAEALAEQTNVVEAFRKLQKLHDQWRETGPVAADQKEALWERFKAASSIINRRHQEHFESLKQEQLKKNHLST